ncbi:chromatin remodelling complex Rsc7/Swp82 subunit-domain-containing protein [Ilyonectria robusta]|uniref:chromatin remodelling complex Rsc7/Swp82 subunit-domain-containing protein n=1 Tax=Ilyonectria robusta TaxID=1079257 RepID=UPI001E8D520F|nr:chromatin remodelling complex Rsc7/Swp82 subunit-domain-containing protein [Ilyonectria robusta]KAH8736840.1 chromatin remodelling complex Rsc7/Swp82 subunit-domain-containing protein [Ilyonectria robusta]
MYSAQQSGADSATINPAALNSPDPPRRGLKRSRTPDLYDSPQPGDDGDSRPLRKRGRPMKSRTSGGISDAPGQAPAANLPQTIPPPQTPQSQSTTLPAQAAYTPTQAPPKTTPTKSTLKALPTVRDHTTDQLNSTGDEYLPREIDEFGEKKVMANGTLQGGREYKCRTFLVPNRGDKLFMLATECARVLGYRDSYLLFNKNRSLFKIIASQAEKDDLVQQEILPFSYRSRQIAIVTARSMFRQFGSRVIVNGRRVRDDYWETKARKQGFTEADLAGEKRPGATKAREAAEAAQNSVLMAGPHPEIVYSNNPGPFPGPPQPHLVQPGMIGPPPGSTTRMPGLTLGSDLSDSRPRDYSGILKTGPRQEITGPAYQDQTRPSPLGELNAQAHHAAEFNRTVNQQRDMRNDYIQGIWRRPHEQPSSNLTQQPVASNDSASVPASRPSHSPHTTATGMSQSGMVSSQSPQMMMTTAPYSQSISAQSNLTQAPMRGMAQSPTQSNTRPTPSLPGSSSSISQGTPSYNYQSGQSMWPQTPQTPQQHSYGSYTTQGQQAHPSQSPASHLRQPSSGQMQPNMQFPGMAGMPYGTGQSMYPTDQTPRQYMPQSAPGGPAVTQAWSGQHSPAQQWWTPGQQPQ